MLENHGTTAHYSPGKIVVQLEPLDKKYIGKEISITLYSGIKLTNGENSSYREEKVEKFIYEGNQEVTLLLDDIADGYRGHSIFIGYFLQIDLGKKKFLFRDKSWIDISGREDYVYHVSNLEVQVSGKYRDQKDEYKKIEALKSSHPFVKIILGGMLLFVLWTIFTGLYSTFTGGGSISDGLIETLISTVLILAFMAIPLGLIMYFSGRGYIDVMLNIGSLDENTMLSDCISGVTKRKLEEIEIQLFALNEERGWYEKDNGSTTTTVHIKKEVGNVLLYSKVIPQLIEGEDIKDHITGKLDTSKIYEKLVPAIEISDHMGLYLCLELRIISKNQKNISRKELIHLDKNKFTKNIKISGGNTSESENIPENSDFFA